MRKPGLDNPFLRLEGSVGQEQLREVEITDRYRDVLDTMGNTFVCGKNVLRHVAEPKAAWQAMLELNDGGMARLTKALRGVAHLDFKLQRLQQQLVQCRQETGRSKPWPLVRKRRRRTDREKTGHCQRAVAGIVSVFSQYWER
ncbi:Putative bacterial virulence factor [Kluyvera cryocrescens]|uniref:Bacterial virulence factor n=1 Tax=Kluyvera cryocrescens TaxID=580 RepID=A0A485CX43_KLUCR|nr:Putative bacterial virulence factor [Kluyvera cryocrescens]